jgi:hypothetical protein
MLTDIQEVDQATLMQMLRYFIKQGGNLITFGPAGTGKTEMAMQASEAEKYDFRYLNLSVLEAPDLIGLPTIDESSEIKRTDYALPKMLPPRGSRERPVVLLVDEVDKAKPELQNPMLELFQFKSINGTPLDVHAVIATANLPDENAFSQPMSHALTNRCACFRTNCRFDPWQDWAVNAGVNPLPVAFLSRNTELLLKPPPSGDDTAYCHPSPRAWTLAAKDLDGARNADVDFQTLLVAGRVGQAAAIKFKVWLEHYRYIEPVIDALVKNGKKPDASGYTLDRVMVCAVAGCDAVMRKCRNKPEKQSKDEHLKEIHKVTENVMEWISSLPSEICIGAAKSTLTMDEIRGYELVKVKPFMDVFMKIRKAMKADQND